MSKKITVVGFGNVGRVLVNLLLGSDHQMELNIMDPAEWLSGAFLDIKHALGMQPNKRVYFNDSRHFQDADFVFFTAGVPGKHGASRLSTVAANTHLVREVFEGVPLNAEMIIIAITNPVDVITAAILQYSQLPQKQILGTGTFLDSIRFSYHLANEVGVDYRDVNAMILGEHGASCLLVASHSFFKGSLIRSSELFTSEKVDVAFDKTQNAAYEIRKTEPGTSIAVAHCALRLMEYFMDTEVHQVSVSVLLSKEWVALLELERAICVSVPVMISKDGMFIKKPIELTSEELQNFRSSARLLSEYQTFLEE